MSQDRPVAHDRLAAAALAAAYATLAVCHMVGTGAPGRAVAVALLAAQEILVAALLLVRRAPCDVSPRRSDRLVVAAALLLPLGLRTPGAAPAGVSLVLEAAGLLLALVATASLGRHLGLLPAVRGVTTRGAYAVVRHPMYAAYMLLLAAYVAGEPSMHNVTLAGAACVLMVVRLRAEEAILERHVDYQAYCRRVPWRLVPGCY
jgi:protein-S-isoprenylcysteine O-methyltransferase Ste14